MRFHLIDRIDEYEPRHWVRGRKLTSHSEEFWELRDGEPCMPPQLVLEALCQAGTWLIMLSTARSRRAALLQIESVRHGAPVRPGDVLLVEGTVLSMNDEVAVLSGTVSVGERQVLAADGIMCALMAADDLEDADASGRMLSSLIRV